MSKKIWRKNFEISRISLQVLVSACEDINLYQSKTVGKLVMKELATTQKDYKNTGSYIPVDQLRDLVESTMKMIIKKPEFIKDIHKKTTKYIDDSFRYFKDILKIDFTKLSDKRLADIFEKVNWYQEIVHGYSLPSTWFVDSDGEDFSNFLLEKVEDIIKAKKLNISTPEVFSMLTTPEKPSLAAKEEIELLKISELIKKDPKSKKIFLQSDIEKIEKDLNKIDIKLRRKILNHYKKWHWVPFTYVGPAYDLDYYLTAWSGLLRQKIDVKKNLNLLENQIRRLKEDKKKIIDKLNLNNHDKNLFSIASEIISIKAYRKDSLYYGCYVLDKINREIAKRLNLSLKQVHFMAHWEIRPALEKGYFLEEVLNDRIKFFVYYQNGNKKYIYTGKKAKKFLESLNIEKEEVKELDELKGTCAHPGKAKGTVKIVNLPEEMGKMEEGDIMVGHTTFPALVPAMKKASAIVTDDGGITCHAAIVARELKTPCIVGTKIITKVLKDGDRVEVDATNGIVKKIK